MLDGAKHRDKADVRYGSKLRVCYWWGFAWVVASLPTTAHAKRGGTIPMTVPSVCTVVVRVV